jgi:hypothetical protein
MDIMSTAPAGEPAAMDTPSGALLSAMDIMSAAPAGEPAAMDTPSGALLSAMDIMSTAPDGEPAAMDIKSTALDREPIAMDIESAPIASAMAAAKANTVDAAPSAMGGELTRVAHAIDSEPSVMGSVRDPVPLAIDNASGKPKRLSRLQRQKWANQLVSEGKSLEEIAAALGCRLSTARSLVDA